MTERDLMRHSLATIAYRLRKCVVGAPPEYADFSPGSDARSTLRIMRHLSSALVWIRSHFEGNFENPPAIGWNEELARFESELKRVDEILASSKPPLELTLQQIHAGPILDIVTHVGQLALYRRLVGSPIPGENFTKADIAIGKLSIR